MIQEEKFKEAKRLYESEKQGEKPQVKTAPEAIKEEVDINFEELERKADEILKQLDGVKVIPGINALVLALSRMIKYGSKKGKYGQCVEVITYMLKGLLELDGGLHEQCKPESAQSQI